MKISHNLQRRGLSAYNVYTTTIVKVYNIAQSFHCTLVLQISENTDMPNCRKCGVPCLDYKVRNAHEEKCTKQISRKRQRRATKTKGKGSINPGISEHGYAMNLSNVLPNISTDHSYSRGVNNLSACLDSCNKQFPADQSDHANQIDHTYSKAKNLSYLCKKCGQRFKYLEKKSDHERKCTKTKFFSCHKCNEQFTSHKELYMHRRKHTIEEKESSLQRPPWEVENKPPPWHYLNLQEANKLEEVYNLHKDIILQNDRIGSIVGIYNIPLDNEFTIDTLMNKISNIYAHSDYTFRINLTFSTILQNIETNEFRYFQGYRNNTLLEDPPIISTTLDLKKLK